MFKQFSFLVFVFLALGSSFAQVNVRSKAYNNMLKDLLSHSVAEISVQDVDENEEGLVFLDARERKEFEVSHIKNAIWIGYDDFKMSRVKGVAKDSKIIIYCSVGYRSEKIGEKLVKAGYNNLFNLYGSIFEWVNQDRVVYDMDGNPTRRVHAFNDDWGRWLKKGEKVYD